MERSIKQKKRQRRVISLFKKFAVPALAVMLIAAAAVGATVAYLVDKSAEIKNKFTTATVNCQVEETFQGNQKSAIAVKNTGDIPAYVRLKLVAYRVDDSGQRIGGTAAVPNFTIGSDWQVGADGCYYCKTPVNAGETSPNLLGNSSVIALAEYTDTDGGKLAIDVVAEAIQAEPISTVTAAWGFAPSSN